MRILDRLNRDLTIELVEQRAVALLIAQECLPYLRKGIRNREDLQRAVDIVREKLPHFQVALTDRTQVLAASGCDLPATPLPIAAREAMAQRETVVMEVSKGHRSAMLSAPLVTDEQVIGALLLIAPTGPNLVLDADVKRSELAQFSPSCWSSVRPSIRSHCASRRNSARCNRRSTRIFSTIRWIPSPGCVSAAKMPMPSRWSMHWRGCSASASAAGMS